MLDQKEAILGKGWDYLLALDACRFDYFEKVYEGYLSGNLEKARSPVSCEHGVATTEWCKEVFPARHENIVYVSTTPHINSRIEVNGFKASEHFHKIIDVWDWGWNEEKGTVLPEKVNKAILKTKHEFPDKKIIAHYMQPHFPYLSFGKPSRPKGKRPEDHDSLRRKVQNFFGSRIRRILGGWKTRRLMEFLKLPPMNPMDEILRKAGGEKLRRGYEKNLHAALKAVAEVSENLSGNIVVTSDHGEYLGENGFYGHSYLPDHPVLTAVPWLKVG